MNQAAERIESLKAAVTGAVTATVVCLIELIGYGWTISGSVDFERFSHWLSFSSLFHLGIAGFSGFLFGVTYRYIVRQDQNPQLKLGAVLAFSLVRSLAQLETTLATSLATSVWAIGLNCLESLLIFGIAALILDQLMLRGWIKPFNAA